MAYKGYRTAGLLLALLLCLLVPPVSAGEVLVGVIFTGNIPYYKAMHESLAEELKKKLPPGQDVRFILQRPFPDPVAWSNAARKLVVGEVDMIISYGYPATNAALSHRSNIPIVYVGVYDPESSINGSNVTGCGYGVSLANLLEYAGQVMAIKRLCVVYSNNEGDSVSQMKELSALAEQQHIALVKMDISTPEDLKKFNELGKGDALYLTGSAFAHVWIEDILTAIREKNIPVVDIFPDSANHGALITLYQDPEELGRKGAELAAKIIGGEQAARIEPVVLHEIKLIFNLPRAKSLGISIPPPLLGKATRVIE